MIYTHEKTLFLKKNDVDVVKKVYLMYLHCAPDSLQGIRKETIHFLNLLLSDIQYISFTVDGCFESSSYSTLPFGRSVPFATSESAYLLTAAPIPSAGPFPCPASRKFHMVLLNPI